jgi:hypothetical protein
MITTSCHPYLCMCMLHTHHSIPTPTHIPPLYSYPHPHTTTLFLPPSTYLCACRNLRPPPCRLGVRLNGPRPTWTRSDGGEGGSHPSNVHDHTYAIGTVNFTGDMPVILMVDGPSLGGFVCAATIVSTELWKIGQVRARLVNVMRMCPWMCAHERVSMDGCPWMCSHGRVSMYGYPWTGVHGCVAMDEYPCMGTHGQVSMANHATVATSSPGPLPASRLSQQCGFPDSQSVAYREHTFLLSTHAHTHTLCCAVPCWLLTPMHPLVSRNDTHMHCAVTDCRIF